MKKSKEISKNASLKLEDLWGLSNDAEDSPYIWGKLKTAFNIFNSGDVIPDSNDGSEESDEKVYEAVEYSCAVKPHVRSDGNRQSGAWEPPVRNLLAQCFV